MKLFEKFTDRAALYRVRRKYPPVPGCVEETLNPGHGCRGTWGNITHGRCTDCGRSTCSRRLLVDPDTLRRKMRYLCSACQWRVDSPQQIKARKARVQKDWNEITTPPVTDHIQEDVMGEQYPGQVRDTIRAFRNSEATRATIIGVSAQSLNDGIYSLGLEKEMYAEIRGTATTLRKISKEN